eukprot:CAMPEP_0170551310 /NCGR_PEP_ID=MMETSP0211-20121228/9333_1 /TAXON_ID=311385 /ORGANISM="Pseudokeronopsis sp., Strain OXSARD2" /LENGTH=61 /DNA_ID=CAMNT_0010858409 /DNA_START=1066 /DNA_END=1251 /DNA_ORIENTATION=+
MGFDEEMRPLQYTPSMKHNIKSPPKTTKKVTIPSTGPIKVSLMEPKRIPAKKKKKKAKPVN